MRIGVLEADIDSEVVKDRVKKLNSNIKVILICAKTGEEIDKWVNWFRSEVIQWNEK